MKNAGQRAVERNSAPLATITPPTFQNLLQKAIERRTLAGTRPSLISGQITVSLAHGEDLFGIRLSGFDVAESNGRWTMANRAKLVIPINIHQPVSTADTTIWIELTPYCPGTHKQFVIFSFGHGHTCTFNLRDFTRQTIGIVLSADATPTHQLILDIQLPNASTPRDLENSDDTRCLGIKLHRLVFTQSTTEPIVAEELGPLVSIASPEYSEGLSLSRHSGEISQSIRTAQPHSGHLRQLLLRWKLTFRRLANYRKHTAAAKVERLARKLSEDNNLLTGRIQQLQNEFTQLKVSFDASCSSASSNSDVMRRTDENNMKLQRIVETTNTKLTHTLSALSTKLEVIQNELQRPREDPLVVLHSQLSRTALRLEELVTSEKESAIARQRLADHINRLEELHNGFRISVDRQLQNLSDSQEGAAAEARHDLPQILGQLRMLNEHEADQKVVQDIVSTTVEGQSHKLTALQNAAEQILNCLDDNQERMLAKLDSHFVELNRLRVTSNDFSQLVGSIDETKGSFAASEQRDNLLLRTLQELIGDVTIRQARKVIRLNDSTYAFFSDNGPILVAATDEKFILQLADQWGMFEPGTTATIRKYLKPGSRFVDVGAHVGWYTLLASRIVGTTGKVWSFEPSPDNAALIRRMLFINDVASIVDFHQVAAGRDPSRATLHVMPISAESSLLPIEGFRHAAEVDVVRLDDVLAADSCVDLIKIDSEGFELEVVAGMAEIMARNPNCKVIAEFGPSHLKRAGVSTTDWFAAFAETGRSAFGINEETQELTPITAEEASQCFSVNILWARCL